MMTSHGIRSAIGPLCRHLLESVPEGIALLDPDTRRILDANAAFVAVLESTRDDLLGQTFEQIGLMSDGDDPFACRQGIGCAEPLRIVLRRASRADASWEGTFHCLNCDGDRLMACHLRAIRNDEPPRDRTIGLTKMNGLLKQEISLREQAEADRRLLQQQLATVQEGERRRISRELHDQMGQHLAALGLGLKLLKNSTPKPSPQWERIQVLQSLTDRIGRDIHHLAMELRPTALDDLGLQAALSNYVEGWGERSGIAVDYHGTGLDDRRLSPAIETTLYRIVQEALGNILKHAAAKHVSVILQRGAESVSAVIEDDGKGFDPDIVGKSRLGIVGMRERTALFGGTLSVESAPGRGATVIARIPLT